MNNEKASELAVKFMNDCIYDIDDKDAVYEYGIDALLEFVKDGILLGYKEGYKDCLKGVV